MSPLFRKRGRSGSESGSLPPSQVEPYLRRLYLESRKTIFLILLGEAQPDQEPFPADPERVNEILRQIEGVIANDEHLGSCRARLGERFPGRLAVLLNLADEDDQLYPLDRLRESIRNHVRLHQESLSGQALGAEDQRALEELKGSSRLQQQLAYLVRYTPGKWLLEQEIPVILESRRRRLKESGPNAAAREATFSPHQDSYAWSRDTGRLSGLCLSGGGIRSATFNLGILQGLASRDLLRRFDYCSSVSGGGYIHQWLAAWIKREEAHFPAAKDSPGLDTVCRRLIPQPNPGCTPIPAEPIRWLRRYSNYLTPETGLLSADLWVTVAIWIRNTVLNQVVLIASLLWLLMVPHVFLIRRFTSQLVTIAEQPQTAPGTHLARLIFNLLILALLMWSSIRVVRRLAEGLLAARKKVDTEPRLTERDLRRDVILPSMVIAIVISCFGFWFALPGVTPLAQLLGLCAVSICGLTALNVAVTWAGGAPEVRRAAGRTFGLRGSAAFALVAVLGALVGTAGLVAARNTFVTGSPVQLGLTAQNPPGAGAETMKAPAQPNPSAKPAASPAATVAAEAEAEPLCSEPDMGWRTVLVFGPLIVMVIPFISVVVNCGLIGHDFEDWVLEWLARVRAWITLYSMLWVVVVGIAFFGHYVLNLIAAHHAWIKWPVIASWLMTTAASVLAGKSARTGGEDSSAGTGMKILTAVGPPVYVLGLLTVLAWAVDEGICRLELYTALLPVSERYLIFCAVALFPLAVFLLFGWKVDVNQFSMHSYYRNRLARCFLGASNTGRDPDPLTGFDSRDVAGLRVSRFQPCHGYTGPLPVFCAALNISVGEDLAWQERKAASFSFSPVLSGYYIPWTGLRYKGQLSYNGFVPTDRFAYVGGGINVSTAAAISGAAVSPNWGYHTSPPMAFLLTMFNVRLGWWLENPRRSWLAFDPDGNPPPGRTPYPRPSFAPAQLFQELIGQVGDDREFVYLTDGGHFDNMGLYELVRRRCYQIVICDAEEDVGPVFQGIGMAIRKCRIDFGVEIDLDLQKLACDAQSRMSKVHWITGTIRYPETGTAPCGTILYIKSSITGDESGDVLNYRLQDTAFPQDSTADQWFSESQFESYRRLGQKVIDECPYLDRM
jgi:hypothetical protein